MPLLSEQHAQRIWQLMNVPEQRHPTACDDGDLTPGRCRVGIDKVVATTWQHEAQKGSLDP